MPKVKFDTAVTTIVKNDSRYNADAYFFLRDALDFTVKSIRADELVEHRHVTGNELLDGMREFALKELGSMSLPVFESWGLRSGKDVGEMVYNLIKIEAFGKSEDDQQEDFERWMSFEDAFQKPFRPTRPVLATSPRKFPSPLSPAIRANKPATPSEA